MPPLVAGCDQSEQPQTGTSTHDPGDGKGRDTAPFTGQEISWGELHVGSRSIFAAAGFAEVSGSTIGRVVMRIDF